MFVNTDGAKFDIIEKTNNHKIKRNAKVVHAFVEVVYELTAHLKLQNTSFIMKRNRGGRLAI